MAAGDEGGGGAAAAISFLVFCYLRFQPLHPRALSVSFSAFSSSFAAQIISLSRHPSLFGSLVLFSSVFSDFSVAYLLCFFLLSPVFLARRYLRFLACFPLNLPEGSIAFLCLISCFS